jgi:branched-chain amino acid transport system substrate-binding protein
MFGILAKLTKLNLYLLILFLFVSCAEKYKESLKPTPYRTVLTHAEDDEGIFNNAVLYYGQQDYSSALSEVKRLKLDSLDPDFRLKVMWLLGNLQFETGDRTKSVSTLIKVMETSTEDDTRSKAYVSLLSNIDKMDINDLRSIEGTYDSIQSYVIFELGEKYMQHGNNGAARSTFRTFIDKYPEHEYVSQAEQYILRMDSLEKVDPYTIGVILPLSGKNAPFGLKSLKGIQLALGVFGSNGNNLDPQIRLAIMDSQDDPEVAKIAVDRLIEEDSVIAIIGPLGMEPSESVAKQCALYGIPNISLSQTEDLEGLGSYVFKIGMSKVNQVQKLVSYAMDDLSIKKFGILYPEDNYGEQFTKYFWNEVLSKGGEVTAVESYPSGQADFRDNIKKMLGLYYIGARRTEYNEIKEKLEEEQKNARVKKQIEVNLPPIQSFEALFVPDDARALTQIAPYLPYYNARNIILMGPNTWNSPHLVSRGKDYVEGAIFVDGFYSYPKNKEGKIFIKEFKSTFNSNPGVLEAQAYDAANVLLDVIFKKNNMKRDAVARAILRDGPYKITTGKVNFSSTGEAEKDLFVLGVERGRIVLKE